LRPEIVDASYDCRNMVFVPLKLEVSIVKNSVGAKRCKSSLG